jgi:hypothetical protein
MRSLFALGLLMLCVLPPTLPECTISNRANMSSFDPAKVYRPAYALLSRVGQTSRPSIG